MIPSRLGYRQLTVIFQFRRDYEIVLNFSHFSCPFQICLHRGPLLIWYRFFQIPKLVQILVDSMVFCNLCGNPKVRFRVYKGPIKLSMRVYGHVTSNCFDFGPVERIKGGWILKSSCFMITWLLGIWILVHLQFFEVDQNQNFGWTKIETAYKYVMWLNLNWTKMWTLLTLSFSWSWRFWSSLSIIDCSILLSSLSSSVISSHCFSLNGFSSAFKCLVWFSNKFRRSDLIIREPIRCEHHFENTPYPLLFHIRPVTLDFSMRLVKFYFEMNAFNHARQKIKLFW